MLVELHDSGGNLMKDCGKLETSYDLTLEGQTYDIECLAVGKYLLLKNPVIRILEIVVISTGLFHDFDHF